MKPTCVERTKNWILASSHDMKSNYSVFHLFDTKAMDYKGNLWIITNTPAPTASPQVNSGTASFHIHNLKAISYERVDYFVASSYQSAVHLLAVLNGKLMKLEANWEPFPGETCSRRSSNFSFNTRTSFPTQKHLG